MHVQGFGMYNVIETFSSRFKCEISRWI